MAISISVLILVIGLISLFTLPVEQYPDIAPPTVYVSANYTGADAEAVLNSVIMPLEESINGVENMMYISSTATNAGSATIQVYFKQGTDPDMAAVNVQNRVSKAQGLLPAEVTKIGVTTQKRQTSFLQIGALVSTDGRYDQTFLANYLDINVIPQIKRIEGVGDVMELGDTYSMRIWLKPERMAQYGLVPSDVTAVLGEQNIEAPTGSLGENSKNVFQFTMKYRGRLKSVEEFQNTVVRSQSDGSVLRLKDVADVALGTLTYSFRSEMDSKPAVLFMMFQTAGSNATAVNKQITAQIDEMRKSLPEGTEFVTMMSSNDFLFASIHNVVETLVIAIILVILVVYFFLQDFKSTLIPSISIIVSLVGTFACLVAAGFSLNILTLFALVLAIGTVVDDAIVVVEAVQSKFDAGYKSPYLATKDAMGDVTMAIISCTCVFMAVFIPVTFMGGTSGVFYTQFGVTMATAVGISMISALTLCPALCAIMMRPSDGTKSAKSINGRVRAAYNASFNAVLGKYKKGVMFFIHYRWMVWTSLAATVVLLVYLMSTTKTGLVPQEDQGVIMVNVSTSPGSTLEETTKVMNKLEDILKNTPEIEHYSKVAGYGLMSGQGTSYGTIIIRLKDWGERKGSEHTSDAVVARLNAQFYGVKEAQIFSFQPGMIPGYGMGNSLELNLQDRTGGDMSYVLRGSDTVSGCVEPASRSGDGVYLLCHELPAGIGRCGCCQVQACGYLAGCGARRVGQLLRRCLYLQLQPVRQGVPRHDAGIARISSGRAGAGQYVCAQRCGDGSGQSVCDVEPGAWSGDGKPLQSVQRYRRQRESGGRIFVRRSAESDCGSGRTDIAAGLRLRVRRHGTRGSQYRWCADGLYLCRLYLPHLSHSGMSLRELPDAVCGHLLRTVRADGFVPLCQSTGIGKQHLSADGCDYVDWSCLPRQPF